MKSYMRLALYVFVFGTVSSASASSTGLEGSWSFSEYTCSSEVSQHPQALPMTMTFTTDTIVWQVTEGSCVYTSRPVPITVTNDEVIFNDRMLLFDSSCLDGDTAVGNLDPAPGFKYRVNGDNLQVTYASQSGAPENMGCPAGDDVTFELVRQP